MTPLSSKISRSVVAHQSRSRLLVASNNNKSASLFRLSAATATATSNARSRQHLLRSFSSTTSTAAEPTTAATATRRDTTLPPVSPSKYWSTDPATGRTQRPIFVAATKQHVGKTTVSLALMSGLSKRFNKVGFLKPVGQQHVPVQDSSQQPLRVDKDVVLMREHFRLDHLDYRHMSPVIIPSGYTKRYLDGEIDFGAQVQQVHTAMEHVHAKSDVVLIEGTGHCAVGSIVGLNNAKVASQLGADMVLM
jgi:hypothetical protein